MATPLDILPAAYPDGDQLVGGNYKSVIISRNKKDNDRLPTERNEDSDAID